MSFAKRPHFSLLQLVIAGLGCTLATEASAANFMVDVGGDGVDVAPGNGVCQTSFGLCSLRAAIIEANALPGPDTIVIDPAVAQIDLSTLGASENACLTGDLDIAEDLTIIGNGVLIDGLGADRIFDVAPGISVDVSDVILLAGVASGANGGAVRNRGELSLSACEVHDSSSQLGGGIYSSGSGLLHLEGCRLSGNGANDGGAIYATSALEVFDSTFDDNHAELIGAGIYLDDPTASSTIDGVVIEHGHAGFMGGGLAVFSFLDFGHSVVRENVAGTGGGGIFVGASGGALDGLLLEIHANGADTGLGVATDFGGGILNEGALTLRFSIVRDNFAWLEGGGVANYGGALIRQSTIHDNLTDGEGGGIFNDDTDGSLATLTLRNSTVSRNQATLDGGGIHVGASGDADLHNATVVENRGPTAGVFVMPAGVLAARNTIIGDNVVPGTLAPSDCTGALTSQGHILVEDTAACTIGGATANDVYGLTPLIGPLANNGGPTPTHELFIGSPAIDAANPATCLPVDQRNVGRPAACDIGAFER